MQQYPNNMSFDSCNFVVELKKVDSQDTSRYEIERYIKKDCQNKTDIGR